MIQVNGTVYQSIEMAALAEGLPINNLNPAYFSVGYGIVEDKEVIFPHLIPESHHKAVCQWITDNHSKLVKEAGKFGPINEDCLQDTFEYMIRKGSMGQIKNFKSAFFNRYQGSLKDNRRKTKIQKATVTESDINTVFSWDDPDEELSVFDVCERSLTDTAPDKSCNEAVNYENKIQAVREVLNRYYNSKEVNFFIDYEMNGRHDKSKRTEDFAAKHGIGKRRARTIITTYRKKVYDPIIQQEIVELFDEYKYPDTIDDLTLTHIIHH